VTRKVGQPLSLDEAAERIREFTTWKIFVPNANDVLSAIDLQRRHTLSFWDAMVAHAAIELGCDTLWTEDLSAGQFLRTVRIQNPFASPSVAPGRNLPQ
jgi:predicted nucleic acid-binding protein